MFGIDPSVLIGPAIGAAAAFAIQAMSWVWSISSHTGRLDFLEKRIANLETAAEKRGAKIDDMNERLSRLEPMIEFVFERLKKDA